MRIHILNTGGTLGMVGNPLRPAKSAEELLEGVQVPVGFNLTLKDYPVRQDSTNVNHDDRIGFAQAIGRVYNRDDAFVVLHGTDSLGETCAFLAMAFRLSLQKPLFVIGAQMTKDEPGSDVTMQIANTLRVADAFHRNRIVGVYSVCLADVLHGGRIRKRKDSDFAAFYTPGRPSVAQAWPLIRILDGVRRVNNALAVQGIHLDTVFEHRVGTIRVSADTPPWMLLDLVKTGRLAGVILECKGTGNIPDRKWDDGENGSYSWIDAIKAATDAGIHVGILSPFDDGRVILDRYELGQKARDAGALSLESLTPDMADVKFRIAIATNPDRAWIQQFLSTDIIGELLTGVDVVS